MTQTFGSRENCREQFNIYHGGIIKVQSSKKRLVRFLPNGEGPSRIRLDFEAFPLMYPVSPPFFLRLILIAVHPFQYPVCRPFLLMFPFEEIIVKRKIIFYPSRGKFLKFLKFLKFDAPTYHRWKFFFFFNFQRDRRERGEKREKIVRGMWWHSSSSLDDKRFTTRRDSKRRHFNEIIM